MDISKDFLRWALLIGAMPIWVPFLRILWRDFNHALRDEGGLIGSPPRGREAERLKAEKKHDKDRLTSEPILRPEDRVRRRMKAPSGRGSAPARGSSGAKSFGFKNARSRGRG